MAIRTGDPEGAIQDATRAIELGGGPTFVWLERGTALAKTGEWARAIPDLEKFLELEPTSPEAPNARSYLEEARRRTP